jgi:hypothetical protein
MAHGAPVPGQAPSFLVWYRKHCILVHSNMLLLPHPPATLLSNQACFAGCSSVIAHALSDSCCISSSKEQQCQHEPPCWCTAHVASR